MAENKRGLVCFFCGEGFGYAGKKPDDATLDAALNHELNCPKNPYKAQISNLTAERDKLGAQAVSAVEAVCVLHKEKAAILAERDRLKGLLAAIVEHYHRLENKYQGNYPSKDGPGHDHDVAGVPDGDSKPCEWCKTWGEVLEALK